MDDDGLWPAPPPGPRDDPAPGPPGMAPVCARCRHRHLSTVRCWAGDLVRRSRRLAFATYGDTCHLCGGAGADTVDHLVPLSMGGTHDPSNLRVAHRYCNISAGNKQRPRRGVATEVSARWFSY